MKKKLYNWLFKKAMKIVALNLVRYKTILTPEYLLNKGWIEKDGFYFEPGIKDKYKISIKFDEVCSWCYNVYYGKNHTCIASESSVEWFENYYLLAHGDNGRYKLAGY